MLLIAKRQLIDGLLDAKLLFFATLVILVFAANGFIYSDSYGRSVEDWEYALANNSRAISEHSDNLQEVMRYEQLLVKPPSVLAFIADGGDQMLPNAIVVNAFYMNRPQKTSRENKVLPILGSIDWSFIVGTLMTLVAALIGFGAVCAEKRDGTLRLLLSYPVSRIKFLIGKFFGLAFALLIVFFIGVTVNILILYLNNALPLTLDILLKIGWAILLSVVCLLLALFVSVAVSSMVSRPAVSLIIIMIGWVFFVFAIPGLARLIAEQTVDIDSKYEEEQEAQAAYESAGENIPPSWKVWYGDPFHESVPDRAEWRRRTVGAYFKVVEGANLKRIHQAEVVNTLSYASPTGILNTAFQQLSGTGVEGYKNLLSTARRYQQQLYEFMKERDMLDNESPHIYYPYSDRGVISTKPVSAESIPKYKNLWESIDTHENRAWPLWHILLLVFGFLQVSIIAIVAVVRYDPR